MRTVEFNYPVDAEPCLAAVREAGAAAVHGFINTTEQAALEAAINPYALALTDNLQKPVAERYRSRHFDYPADCPLPVAMLGAGLVAWLNTPGPLDWHPNDVFVQRYGPGDRIARHRDFKRSIGLVAVTTISGEAPFFAELDGMPGETPITVRPGTLVLMRAPGLVGEDNRPCHRVDPPTTPARVAVTFRQTITATH